MARLSLTRQPVQVHSNQAIDILLSSPCISSQCKLIVFYPTFATYSGLQLPDDIKDAYIAIYEKAPSSATLTHLKRELIHAAYELILNSKFMDAYKDGFVVTCYDGIQRRLFIRLLTYSGDYPEKWATFYISHRVLICLQSTPCWHQISWEVSLPAMSRNEI